MCMYIPTWLNLYFMLKVFTLNVFTQVVLWHLNTVHWWPTHTVFYHKLTNSSLNPKDHNENNLLIKGLAATFKLMMQQRAHVHVLAHLTSWLPVSHTCKIGIIATQPGVRSQLHAWDDTPLFYIFNIIIHIHVHVHIWAYNRQYMHTYHKANPAS